MSTPTVMPDPSFVLTCLFAFALTLGLLIKFWLSSRQVRHVSSHRSVVPAAFTQTISLTAHQKAADYTVAKVRLGLLEMTLGAVVLLGWTLLGGLSVLNERLVQWMGNGM